MKIDDFKAALRKACDDQVDTMSTVVGDFLSEVKRLEDAVKAEPGSDRELISLVIEAELKRYSAKLDSL